MTIDGRCKLYGVMWWVGALVLAARARPWFGEGGLAEQDAWLALGIAAVLGYIKGNSVMRQAARKARGRITRRGHDAPPWSIFEPGVVLLVVGMMALGFAIRMAPYPDEYRPWIVGIAYPAVALALVIGSVPLLQTVHDPWHRA